MSDMGKLSIWDDDTAIDTWYNAAVKSNGSVRSGDGNYDMEEMLYYDITKSSQVKHSSITNIDKWFYAARAEHLIAIGEEPLPVQSYSSSRVAKSCGLVLPTNRSGKLITDKPLPPIPNSPRSFVSKGVDSPYFEYMFASAGVGKDVAHGKYSPDNLSFVVDSGASNDGKSGIYVWDEGKDNVSFGLDSDVSDDSMSGSYTFDQDEHDNVSFEIDNYVSDDDMSVNNAFDQDEEKISFDGSNNASDDSMSDSYKSNPNDDDGVSDNHATNEDEDAPIPESVMPATPDHDDDITALQQLYTSGFTTHAFQQTGIAITSKGLEENYRAAAGTNLAGNIHLNGVDQDDKSAATAGFYGGFAVEESPSPYHAPNTNELSGFGDVRDGAEAFPEQWQIHGDKKRNARDSFVTKSTYNTSSSDDEEVQYLYTKKVCVAPGESNYAVVGSVETKDPEVVSMVSTRLEAPPVGYPGQFAGMNIEAQAIRTAMISRSGPVEKQTFTMGDRLHPNYLYTHPDFHACAYKGSLDYDYNAAEPGTNVAQCIEYAWGLSLEAAEQPRTVAEEALRREIHHECAMARLEGVSVGEYRYYQGHLNIEECVQAGFCVCWDVCECSKMCTRFGDLVCPCSGKIVLHQ